MLQGAVSTDGGTGRGYPFVSCFIVFPFYFSVLPVLRMKSLVRSERKNGGMSERVNDMWGQHHVIS